MPKLEGRGGVIGMTLLIAALVIGPSALASDVAPRVKADLLGWINQARAEHGLKPLAFDLHASDAADDYCRKQLAERTTGHFDRDGLPPYARYSAAGIIDGVIENSASWSSDTPFAPADIRNFVRKSHESMLAEKPPDDGHRAALLDPYATHVGIGLAWSGGELRLVEVFLRHYLQWTHAFPTAASSSDRPWGAATPLPGVHVDQISVYWEPYPHQLTADEANRIDSYGFPARHRDYRPRALLRSPTPRLLSSASMDARKRDGSFTVDRDGSFDFVAPFDDGPGLYTIVVWVTRDGESKPFAASNASIRVGVPLLRTQSVAGGR